MVYSAPSVALECLDNVPITTIIRVLDSEVLLCCFRSRRQCRIFRQHRMQYEYITICITNNHKPIVILVICDETIKTIWNSLQASTHYHTLELEKGANGRPGVARAAAEPAAEQAEQPAASSSRGNNISQSHQSHQCVLCTVPADPAHRRQSRAGKSACCWNK